MSVPAYNDNTRITSAYYRTLLDYQEYLLCMFSSMINSEYESNICDKMLTHRKLDMILALIYEYILVRLASQNTSGKSTVNYSIIKSVSVCVWNFGSQVSYLSIKRISRLVIVIWNSINLHHALFALVSLNIKECENFFRVCLELPVLRNKILNAAFLEPTLKKPNIVACGHSLLILNRKE